MTVHRTKLPKEFKDFAREEGFSPYATVVPSAAGMPLGSNLDPEESLDHAQEVFRAAREVIKGGIVYLR